MGFSITLDGARHWVEIVARRPNLVVSVDGRAYEVSGDGGGEEGRQTLAIAGAPATFIRVHAGEKQILRLGGRTFETELLDPRAEAEAAAGGYDHIRAPMPGSVIQIHKQPGDAVARGDTLVTIESMKLQMALLAPRDGRLAALIHSVGETFEKDAIVAELEPLTDQD